jgi:hypothetical protein
MSSPGSFHIKSKVTYLDNLSHRQLLSQINIIYVDLMKHFFHQVLIQTQYNLCMIEVFVQVFVLVTGEVDRK